MILKAKAIPLDARPAMGFRGKIGDRSCFFCGTLEENNFDRFGKLQMLRVYTRDKNLQNSKPNNHFYRCERCMHRS